MFRSPQVSRRGVIPHAHHPRGTAETYLQTTFTTAGGGDFRYQDMTSVTDYLIATGDVLEYGVYYETVANLEIALDLTLSTGNLRDSGAVDQNSLSAHPGTNITAHAQSAWYDRTISLSGLVGRTIQFYDLAAETATTTTRVARFRRMVITNGGSVVKTIWDGGAAPTTGLHMQSGTTSYSQAVVSA